MKQYYISIALRPRIVQVTTSINNKVYFIVYYILIYSINNRIPRMLETKCVIELFGNLALKLAKLIQAQLQFLPLFLIDERPTLRYPLLSFQNSYNNSNPSTY